MKRYRSQLGKSISNIAEIGENPSIANARQLVGLESPNVRLRDSDSETRMTVAGRAAPAADLAAAHGRFPTEGCVKTLKGGQYAGLSSRPRNIIETRSQAQ